METAGHLLDAVYSWQGCLALSVFGVAYFLVIIEERTHLKKSLPMILAAGLVWILVAIAAQAHGKPHIATSAVKHTIEEYGELLLFLLAAMTFVNVLSERKVFEALRCWLIQREFTLRQLFWASGLITFFLSPVVDNLTAALIMCYVVMAVGKDQRDFVALACINIVIASNAGGAFSPFGDITTLMVWQSGAVPFVDFFSLFLPSFVSFFVPAWIMSFFVTNSGTKIQEKMVTMERGALGVVGIFAFTLAMAAMFQVLLHLPAVLGMMVGLGLLGLYAYYLRAFDLMQIIEKAEWDTLLFFYGVILCVSGLGTLGYLETLSTYLYSGIDLGLSAAHQATPANIGIGLISAVLDNIPVVYAVLAMSPEMSLGQWLLITLTAGIGGSLLSVGSAAGVALMGQAGGQYTFFSHLKWTPAILLGYAAGILVHLWVNAGMF